MAKSVQNYIDELYSQGKTEADRLKEQRTQADDKLIQQTNAAIDKAAAASAKPYQTQLDELPALYGKLYDANAVQELVNRRQVQETMANMGLTDSGLNRTQQTAIALQRGNADAQVRLSQQQKTQELQDRIDQLLGNSAAQKIQQEADIRNATEKWYSSTLENLRSSAAQQGTSAYNAQMQAQAAEAKAREQAAQAAAQLAWNKLEAVMAYNLKVDMLRAQYGRGGTYYAIDADGNIVPSAVNPYNYTSSADNNGFHVGSSGTEHGGGGRSFGDSSDEIDPAAFELGEQLKKQDQAGFLGWRNFINDYNLVNPGEDMTRQGSVKHEIRGLTNK